LLHEIKHFQANLLGGLKKTGAKHVGETIWYRPIPKPLPERALRSFKWELEEYGWWNNQITEFDIEEDYDRWYWCLILHIISLIQHRATFVTALSAVQKLTYAEHAYDTEDEWRAHHYFMYKAVRRNTEHKCLPPWLWRSIYDC
jgi:hypothetical protein